MIRAPVRAFPLLVAIGVSSLLQNRDDNLFTIANDKLTLAMRAEGGAMVRLVLNDDPDAVNPMHTRLGHFVCVDGFGPVSAEERQAGLPGHGEAHRVGWQMLSSEKRNGVTSVTFSARLPLVHEVFRRTIHLVDGENVVHIESALENELAFDRPINWGEHATIGPPFLELGKTVVEMSATRGMTRAYGSQSDTPPHRLADAREFAWPMAPVRNGSLVDVRLTPRESPIGDHTTSLMNPARRLVFVTAFHPDKRLLLGYVFRREEFPWTQLWEFYPDDGRIARGLEFATQPFDLPRREVIQANAMFDTPTYRWLPAKSTIRSAFLMFYTRTPDRFGKVDDVVLEGGRLTIHDRTTGITIALSASRGL
jgi:hypothetical protein